jgi:hypothetical protein
MEGKVAVGVGGALAFNRKIVSYSQYISLRLELIPFLKNDDL